MERPLVIFNLREGYGKGTPMSPFLFLICADGFSTLLRRRKEYGSLHGVLVASSTMPLCHLFFADNAVIFCRAMEEEVLEVMEVLRCYAEVSRQIVNREKNSLYFGAKCSQQQLRKLATCTNIQGHAEFGKYLGTTTDFEASKKTVFEGVRKALEGRINGWAEPFLSPTGKKVLIKGVAMTLLNYVMSCFKLAVGLCKELESAIANFWWRGNKDKDGMHWVSWQKMKRSKKTRGLEFQDLLAFKLAYLAKIGWHILLQPGSLLGQILKAKYFPDQPFMEAKVGSRSSWGWKGIMQGWKVLEQGLRWRVGDGWNIQVKQDPWTPRPYTFSVRSTHSEMLLMVGDLIDSELGSWNSTLVRTCFKEEESTMILGLPVSVAGCMDRIIWHYSDKWCLFCSNGVWCCYGDAG